MSEVIFRRFDRFARVKFSDPPDFFHWTTQVPAYCVGAKNLYTIHDLVPLRMPGSTLDDKDRYVRVHKAIAARADAILTVSDHSKRDIVEYLNAPAEKVSVIPPLVEPAPDILNEPEAEARQVLHSAYGLQWKEYFLYFGSIEPKKNLARQIEAYAGTGVRYPLVVVSALNWLSDDDFILLKPYLEDGASSPLQKSVRRLDYLPRKQIHRLMRGARSLLFASSYEGFGLPVAEAATYGTPSIAGRGHSMEYAGGTGAIYVDPFNVRDIRDAIKRMADDDTFVATLGARAMVESRRFCHDSHAKSLIALYSRLTP